MVQRWQAKTRPVKQCGKVLQRVKGLSYGCLHMQQTSLHTTLNLSSTRESVCKATLNWSPLLPLDATALHAWSTLPLAPAEEKSILTKENVFQNGAASK